MFDSSFFDKGLDRRNTNATKWNAEILPEGAIPLWVADMDFATAPAITDALVRRAQHPTYGYTYESESARQAVIAYMKRRHGIVVNGSEMLLMASVVSGLRAAVHVFTSAGDKVAIMSPVYGPFHMAVTEARREKVEVPLLMDGNNRYSVDYEGLESALKSGVRLLILCSPHNPVSRFFSEEELRRVIGLAARYGAALVFDEIHADFVFKPNRFVSALALSLPDNAVVLGAASKTFNVAGLKQSYLFARCPETKKRFQDFFTVCGAEAGNLFALTGTEAAFTRADDWLDGLKDYLAAARPIVSGMIAELLPQAKVSPMEATYLAWVDLRAYCQDHGKINDALKRAGVLLTDGEFFGKPAGTGFMRLNYGCPHAQLREGIRRFAKGIQSL